MSARDSQIGARLVESHAYIAPVCSGYSKEESIKSALEGPTRR
jgi:hypothetical protein